MTIDATRQRPRWVHAPAGFTLAACASLGLLLLGGLAGALGLG